MKTPFYERHKSLNAKMVDFHGWIMPLQYPAGIINEHKSVRKSAGLFDVSHMGRFEVKGPNSMELLQNLMTNDISKLQENQALYSPMCYESGGIVDDLIIYMISRERFLLVVNSSNIQKDFEWILEHGMKETSSSSSSVSIDDVTDSMALLALQGPLAQKVLQEVVADINFDLVKPFNLLNARLFGVECIISRTGYTGEDGFEIFFNSSEVQLWDKLLQLDSKFDIRPAGLGARDSLRLEAGFMLYGNDIDENITPLEVPLAWTVKFDKIQDFVGKNALRTKRLTRKLVGFEMLQRKRIARGGSKVFLAGSNIGFITSGGFSPTLNKSIGFCFVPSEVPFDQIVDLSITKPGQEGTREGAKAREEGKGEGEGGQGERSTIGIDLYTAKIRNTRFYKRNKDVNL
jgi:aminomethyltransferase